MPPPRRRPVPTPPAGGRPKVAGLTRRTSREQSARPAEPAASTESAEAVDDLAVTPETTGSEVSPAPESAWSDPLPELDADPAPEDAPEEAPEPRRATWHLPAALLAVAVLLGALGTFFLVKSRAVDYDAALVDTVTTSEVNGQVREAVERSFSYNFADVAATERAAAELLTGRALCQYNAVFGPVKEVAPQQKLVVTVRVVSSAVSSLRDGHATVLVFADQVTTRTTDNQSGGGTAMLRVGAVADGERWKIDNMEMFGATAEQNRQLEGC